MHRIFFSIPLPWGSVPVYAYGTMLAIGFLLTTWIAGRRARARGIERQVVTDLALYAVLAGVIGSRLAFILFDLPAGATIADWFKIWEGGLTFQGGLIAGMLVSVWITHSRKVAFWKMADCFAPAMAVGVAIGRVGCFLNGCCWGKICAPGFPLGVHFPADSFVHEYHYMKFDELWPVAHALGYTETTIPFAVHPAQLYATVSLLLLALAIVGWEKLRLLHPSSEFSGKSFLGFLGGYSVIRFLLELVRDDTPPYWAIGSFPGLRLGQILAIATLMVTILLWMILKRHASGIAEKANASGTPVSDDEGKNQS